MSDRYRNDDWDTSKDAGEATDPKGECRDAVHLAHMDNPDGLNDAEMNRIVTDRRVARGLKPFPVDSMRKRRTDLYHDGIVIATDERRPSPDTGSTMIVWKLAVGEPIPVPRRSRTRVAKRLTKLLGDKWVLVVDDPDGYTRYLEAQDLDLRERSE